MVCSPAHDSKQGGMNMKRLSTALLGAGLMALTACGGAATNNAAANNVVANDVYDVSPDEMNALGNEMGNAAGSNASANASSNASGNSH